MSKFREKLSDVPTLLQVSTQESGWTMKVGWSRTDWSDGPIEATISLAADAGDDVRERGLTTGVLRRLEGRLTALIQEFHGAGDQGAYEAAVDELEGVGPRDRPEDYYILLLDAYLLARRLYPADATKRLAAHLDVPRGTLATRLDVAKRKHPEIVAADRQAADS